MEEITEESEDCVESINASASQSIASLAREKTSSTPVNFQSQVEQRDEIINLRFLTNRPAQTDETEISEVQYLQKALAQLQLVNLY